MGYAAIELIYRIYGDLPAYLTKDKKIHITAVAILYDSGYNIAVTPDVFILIELFCIGVLEEV